MKILPPEEVQTTNISTETLQKRKKLRGLNKNENTSLKKSEQ